MNRRQALLSTLLLGGLAAPRRLSARQVRERFRKPTRLARRDDPEESPDDDSIGRDEPAEPAADDGPPAGFRGQKGYAWSEFDISRYSSLAPDQNSPQTAIIEWIFRRTGSTTWHGDKISVLCAGRNRLLAYHDASTREQVAEIVERFTKATNDLLKIRIRIVVAADTSWRRYVVYSRLKWLAAGPQGQQVWAASVQDAAFIQAQMSLNQWSQALADESRTLVNGQTISITTTAARNYAYGLQRSGGSGVGFQAATAQLEEGVVFRISPLLTFEGDLIDAAIDARTNSVQSLHPTKVLTPREVGPPEMIVDVPETDASRLNKTVKNWPVGQTLLISAGVHPGLLMPKGGLINNVRNSFSYPELLIFVDLEPVKNPPRTARSRFRDRD